MGPFPKRIAKGRVLCHNHVRYQGFRIWTDTEPPSSFVKCPCKRVGDLSRYARRDHVEFLRKHGNKDAETQKFFFGRAAGGLNQNVE